MVKSIKQFRLIEVLHVGERDILGEFISFMKLLNVGERDIFGEFISFMKLLKQKILCKYRSIKIKVTFARISIFGNHQKKKKKSKLYLKLSKF